MALTDDERTSVLRHVPGLADAAKGLVLGMVDLKFDQIIEATESPIEALFALGWRVFYPICEPQALMTLHRQFGFSPINGRNYRADFAIWPTDLDTYSKASEKGAVFSPVIVELDGHDFHERTRDQVVARNQRDRDFLEKGYVVLHFSGSEIHRNPRDVFDDVFAHATSEWRRYIDAARAAGVWIAGGER